MALAIDCNSPPNGLVGQFYFHAFPISGGVEPYSISSAGTLPPGLALSMIGPASAGVNGTPTLPGTYNFTLQVTDSTAATASIACSITVTASALSVTFNGPPSGILGAVYFGSASASGGATPYTFSISLGTLPPVLALNPTTGAITGTATTIGTYVFTVMVTDAAATTATAPGQIIIAALPSSLTISCNNPPSATVGTPYSSTLLANGGTTPYTFSISAGALPPGLTLTPGNGLISGTPTTIGTFSFTAKVIDAAGGTATVNCSITALPSGGGGGLTFSCNNPPRGTVGTPYSHSLLASGGTPPWTFTITAGTVPAGLSMNVSGLISGTPAIAGTFSFTVRVTDALAATAGGPCAITIQASGPLPPPTPGGGGPATGPATITPGIAGSAFSLPEITKQELQQAEPFKLNTILRFLAEQIAKTQGGQGPFLYGTAQLTIPNLIATAFQTGLIHILSGPGNPNNRVDGVVGDLYLRTDVDTSGVARGPVLWVKESNAADGWVSK